MGQVFRLEVSGKVSAIRDFTTIAKAVLLARKIYKQSRIYPDSPDYWAAITCYVPTDDPAEWNILFDHSVLFHQVYKVNQEDIVRCPDLDEVDKGNRFKIIQGKIVFEDED